MSEEKKVTTQTANQVVASNLWFARDTKGWSQEETAERLAPYLGVRWSKASYSAAERSRFRRDRIRHFTADELVAFAAVFDLPVQYFFVPHWAEGEDVLIAAGENDDVSPLSLTQYVSAVFGNRQNLSYFTVHLDHVFKALPEDPELINSTEFRDATRAIIRAHSLSSTHDLTTWHEVLSEISDFIRDVDKGYAEAWDRAVDQADRPEDSDDPEA